MGSMFTDEGRVNGNMRNQLLPFQAKKTSPYSNPAYSGDSGFSYSDFNHFSFRTNETKDTPRCKINIMPEDRGVYNEDIGVQLLASMNMKKDNKGKSSLDTIMNMLPGIQIREYTQDTKLDTVFSMVKYFVDGYKDGSTAEENNSKNDKSVLDKASFVGGYAFETLKDTKFWDELIQAAKSSLGSLIGTIDDEHLILDMIHAFYFRMVGSVTTNYYTIPNSDPTYMVSDGSQGWPGPQSIGGLGTSNNAFFGKLLNFVSSNVSISMEPIWRPGGDPTSSINIKLNLFNDTLDHAINNFLFVNTIIPQNHYLQYALFKFPPSCYDIKIEGGRRLFMCSGSITCNNKGVIRQPSEKFIKELANNHVNGGSMFSNFKKELLEMENPLVRIPDVYELDMKFTSLLPDNFNTYLMQFTMNNKIKEHSTNTTAFWQGEVTNKIKQLGEKLSTLGEKATSKIDGKEVGYFHAGRYQTI